MASNKKKKKKRMRLFLLILCFMALALYGGVKGGEFLAKKLTKPIDDSRNYSEGSKDSGKATSSSTLSENDMVTITAAITEFIEAEHMKKEDRLAALTSGEYYNTLLKNLKQIASGEAKIQDVNYKELSKDRVMAEVIYIKNAKKNTETITLIKENNIWKVNKIER